MTFRDEVRKLLEDLPATPVALPHPDPRKLQIAICQFGAKKYGTVNCNGVIYAWRKTQ